MKKLFIFLLFLVGLSQVSANYTTTYTEPNDFIVNGYYLFAYDQYIDYTNGSADFFCKMQKNALTYSSYTYNQVSLSGNFVYYSNLQPNYLYGVWPGFASITCEFEGTNGTGTGETGTGNIYTETGSNIISENDIDIFSQHFLFDFYIIQLTIIMLIFGFLFFYKLK